MTDYKQAMDEFFTSIPDDCPECGSPLSTNVTLQEGNPDVKAATVELTCPDCGYSETHDDHWQDTMEDASNRDDPTGGVQ